MSTNKFQYWPSDGQLGSTKFTMPTNAEDWPNGDALIGNFVYNEGKLVDFIDIKALVANESKSTTFPYDYVNIQVDKSLEDVMTFNRGERTKNLTITYTTSPNDDGDTFDYIIVDFNTTDQAIIDAVRDVRLRRVVDKTMYDTDENVIGTWDTSKIEVGGIIDFENEIIDGLQMDNIFLSEFDSDLSSLIDGAAMFYGCSNLITFTPDLSSLTNGEFMFTHCSSLTSFESNLSSLTNGSNMFYACSNLTTFNANLSSLINGNKMFNYCKLDSASVGNICDTINTVENGIITLGIGCDESEADNFASEIGARHFAFILSSFQAKGWDVQVQYNGRPTTTYSLRRTAEPSLPVFVKLEEVEETEKCADYISIDGSKKYVLDWFHETTGSTEGYTQFNSLEDAMTYWNIFPKENIISTEE